MGSRRRKDPSDRWCNEYVDPETGEIVREEYDRRVENVGGEKYEYERAIVTREQPEERMNCKRRTGGGSRGCGKSRDPCSRGGGGRARIIDDVDCGGGKSFRLAPPPKPYRDPCLKEGEELPNTDEQLAQVEEKFNQLEKQLKEACENLNSGLCKVQQCMKDGFSEVKGKMKEIEKSTDGQLQDIDDQIRGVEEDLTKSLRLLGNDIGETQDNFCRNLDKAKRDVEKMEKFFKREICETIRDLKASTC